MLYFGSFSLLVSTLLLTVSTLEKRPESRLQLRNRSREVGQLASDQRDVVLGCHFASKSKAARSENDKGSVPAGGDYELASDLADAASHGYLT